MRNGRMGYLLLAGLVGALTLPSSAEASELNGEAYLHAEKAYAAFEKKSWAESQQEAEATLSTHPDEVDLLFLLARSLDNQGKRLEADSIYRKTAQLMSERSSAFLRSTTYWRLAELAEKSGNVDEALTYGEKTVETMPGNEVWLLQYAYMALRSGRDAVGLDALEKLIAKKGKDTPSNVWQDAAYAAKRLGKNDKARTYFTAGIDALPSPEQVAPEKRAALEKLRYDLQRENESLEREWGIYTSLTYWNSRSQAAVLQGSMECYWTPYRKNGQTVTVFNRYYGNIWNGASSTGPFAWSPRTSNEGMDTVQGGLGVSWKPLTNHNFILTAERLFRVGSNSTDDWLMRAAYGWDIGSDYKTTSDTWRYVSAYSEYDYWENADRKAWGTELRWGRSSKHGRDGTVVTPHVFLTVNYDSGYAGTSDDPQWSAAAGPGIVVRQWYRHDRYHAPRSYSDLTLQYRFHLKAERTEGLLIQWLNSY